LTLLLTSSIVVAIASLILTASDPQSATSDTAPATAPATRSAEAVSRPDLSATQPADPAENARVQLLETVGSLSAARLYQAYLAIGLLADAKEEGVYELKDAQGILATLDTLLAASVKKFEALSKLEAVGKNDRETLSKLAELHRLLARLSQQLQAYWKSGNQKDAEKYEETRKEAWKGLSGLLHLEE
jgi:hypothetical protein